MEIVLSSWCGSDDICTRIAPEDEIVRASYGGMARNFLDRRGAERFTNHMPAFRIMRELPELWASAYTFTVERHPYEKVISRAYWNIDRRGGSPEHELEKEIEAAIATRSYVNYPLYTIARKVCVDEVIQHEGLWARLSELALKWDVRLPCKLPQAKGAHRKDRRPAREMLTPMQRQRIASDAALEFELFGYQT